MTFALLSLIGLAAGFGGLAWGYFVLGPRERTAQRSAWIQALNWRHRDPERERIFWFMRMTSPVHFWDKFIRQNVQA